MQTVEFGNRKAEAAAPMAGLDGLLPESSIGERIEQKKLALPAHFSPYTDKYFLRALEILKAERLNPWVRGQVFIRKGPGHAAGIEEAVAIIDKYSKLREHGGRVYALSEGSEYQPKETLLLIEGPAQDIVALETMYLGVLAAETTRANDGVEHVDLDKVRESMRLITELTGGRPVIYMGARHWTFREDALIAAAAFEGGATETSTDVGAAIAGKAGVGTIPHVLENILAFYCGRNNAVKEATCAFDRVISPAVPRIALVDYNNREIDDSLATARALHSKVKGGLTVRVDTCGENLAQGAFATLADVPAQHLFQKIKDQIPPQELKYWFGNGVTVSGVYALRTALDKAGFAEVKILLSSGFAEPAKVAAFVRAEKILGVTLFCALGAGQLFEPCRSSKMDIVAVADRREELDAHPISKAGRHYNPNPKLRLVLGNDEH